MGEGGAQRDGRRRFAGLSGLEKQGSKDGASAEQGSSFREGDSVTQTCSVRMGNGPNTLQTHGSQMEQPRWLQHLSDYGMHGE